MSETRDLLIEVGCEEIPARFMAGALEQFGARLAEALDAARLPHGPVKTFGTARRLAALVQDVAERQSDLDVEARGPSRKAAFDEAGRPTKAAEGFARGQGVPVEFLVVREVDGGEYVFARRTEKGRAAADVLPEAVAAVITGIDFPKSMRWGDGDERFARPIRWLLGMFGSEALPFAVGDLGSSTVTYGHRFLHPGSVVLEKPSDYVETLRRAYVLADVEERRRTVWSQVQEAAAAVGGRVEEDEQLLQEITFLVEWPLAFTGSFPEQYLEVPSAVLETSMKANQRYFPVHSPEGALINRFVAVMNGLDRHLDIVRAGNEKVLLARLADARFFWDEDRKRTLASRLEDLKQVLFQETLGSMYDKVQRIRRLAAEIGKRVGLAGDALRRLDLAAELAKADLTTGMVKEFPELQGYMGKAYALQEGLPEAVAIAIDEHYRPRQAGGPLPATDLGRIVALADKLDTIVGTFRAGLIPTGSQDPYALRRQALGVAAILADAGWALDVEDLVNYALEIIEETAPVPRVEGAGEESADRPERAAEGGEKRRRRGTRLLSADEAQAAVLDFLRARLEYLLAERGFSHGVVQAVVAVRPGRVAEAVRRAEAVAQVAGGEGMEDLLAAFRRVGNLTEKADGSDVDPGRLQEPAEKRLWDAFRAVETPALEAIERGDFAAYFRLALSLKPEIDNFLDNTLVMAEDARVRTNRLALLRRLSLFFTRVADLSKLTA